jgi:protein gp37
MNEQKPPHAIEWTRIKNSDGTTRRGFSWNVVTGCQHACRWEMPDGAVAECYAKTVAEGVAQAAYPRGFEYHGWHPERLGEPLNVKEGAGVFLDSMADLMGHWVEDSQIRQVLDVCRKASQHTFFLLTKNAPRLLQFEFPDNIWTGVSSPPDWMFGKRLSREQQVAMLHRTMRVLSEARSGIRWLSCEPLSWDIAPIVAAYPDVIQWAVIGAASNGRREFPPAEAHVRNLLGVLDTQGARVFFKGNLRSLPYAAANWREDFPIIQTPSAPGQLSLF